MQFWLMTLRRCSTTNKFYALQCNRLTKFVAYKQ